MTEASLSDALPFLASTGAGGLAWNTVKQITELRGSEPARELRQHAQTLVLEAARYEAALEEVVAHFEDAGLEPLLFKGWAVAQHYASPPLRAFGDADFCAPLGRFDEMAQCLRKRGFHGLGASGSAESGRTLLLVSPSRWPDYCLLIDLHERVDKFFAGPPEDVFARARRTPLGDRAVQVPAPEDHLKIVAMHLLRHGAWRPLWLCDVAALLETLPDRFDWDLCLGAQERRRRWIACTFELARELLGAHLGAVPAAARVSGLPRWLRNTVVRSWGKPFSHHEARMPMEFILRHGRSTLLREAFARWPNGIRASMELDADVTSLPRWPYQLVYFLRQGARVAQRGPDIRFSERKIDE